MDAYKISVKLFVESDSFGPTEFIPVFHRWIQDHVLDDHLLIDVADYGHVHDGPGSLLVAHEANLHMDRTNGRLGLLYFRKKPLPGSFGERLRTILAAALNAASKLEQEPGFENRLKFRGDEISIRFHDRLLTPNTPETFEAVRSEINALAAQVYVGSKVTVTHVPGKDQLLEVKVTAESRTNVSQLLRALGQPTPA